MPRDGHTRRAVSVLEHTSTLYHYGGGAICIGDMSVGEGWIVCVHKDGGETAEPVSEVELLQTI